MRKFLIPIMAAASAVAVAAPATAQYVQWRPPVYQYNPYDYGSGFRLTNYVREMQVRVERVRSDIRVMQQRHVLSWNEARGLDNQARRLQRRIFMASRNGMGPGEARSLENQIFNLQRRVAQEANDWDRRYGHHRRHY